MPLSQILKFCWIRQKVKEASNELDLKTKNNTKRQFLIGTLKCPLRPYKHEMDALKFQNVINS